MIYILDGPDGAGKTGLAEKIQEGTNYEIKSFSYPKSEHEKKYMFEMYKDVIDDAGQGLIMDRSWYSDMVYSPIMRAEPSPIDIEAMNALERRLNIFGAMIIHCTDRSDVLWERCTARGEDYVTSIDTLRLIKTRYEYLLHDTVHSVPVLRYELSKSL